MFDIGWSELLVVAVIAIIVVGPKDLPRMLRAFGQVMGQVRRTANEFRRQFDDALREAEAEADLADTKKTLESLGKIDPMADVKDEIKSLSTMVPDTSKQVSEKPEKSQAKPEKRQTKPEKRQTKSAKAEKSQTSKAKGKSGQVPQDAATGNNG